MKRVIHILSFILLVCAAAFPQQSLWHRSTGTYGLTAALDIYRKDPDTLYAINDKFIRSPDGGGHWDTVAQWGTDIGALKVDPTNSQIVYLSRIGLRLESNDVLMSTNGGTSWRLLFVGQTDPVAVIEIDPQDSRMVYVGVGSNRIYRTINQGATWDTITPTNAYYLTALAIAPSHNSILYAGFVNGLFKSTDRGNSWASLSLGFPMQAGPQLAVDPRNPDVVYATVYNVDTTQPSGVFKTTDGGATWVEKDSGLSEENKQIRTIIIHPKYPDDIYVGTKNSSGRVVSHSTDAGEHWSDFSNGFLPTAGVVTALVIDTLHNRMYAGAVGIYFLDPLVTNVDARGGERPSTYELAQNYPNPFNPTTTIEFSLPTQAVVTLEIFDVLGRRVASLMDDQTLMPGRYKEGWNAQASPSGVYYYRIVLAEKKNGGSVIHRAATKQMLLIR